MSLMRHGVLLLAAAGLILGVSCQNETDADAESEVTQEETPQHPCTPDQLAPYDATTPYLGIHGDAGNSDVVPCDTAPAFDEVWQVLKGHAIAQPNTFSPDASKTYVTAFPTEEEQCTLYALDAETGATEWCKVLPSSVVASSVEVDEDGMLYVGAASALYSYTPAGDERWKLPLDGGEGGSLTERTFGVHFTQSGHIATVTLEGRALLVDRATGEVAAELDLKEAYGFVSPTTSLPDGLDIVSFFPEPSIADLEKAFGGRDAANLTLSNFLGVSGNFTDNTVAVSIRDEIYFQGGGPTTADGSIIQVNVRTDGDSVSFEKGWYVLAEGGSAASPSISRNGKYMVLSDGASSGSSLSSEQSAAYVVLVDVEACNTNTDSDPLRERCGAIKKVELERGAMSGAPPIADDGTVYYWESGLDFVNFYDNADLFSFGPEQDKRAVALDDRRDWTSVMTVSNNHLIGTISKYTESEFTLMVNTLPATIEHRLALFDRSTFELVWSAEVTDDSTSTITIDKTGSLYVTLFGLLNIIATEERPTLGLVKFTPTP